VAAVQIRDARLQGARYVAGVSSSRVAVAARDTRRIGMLNIAGGVVAGVSAVLDAVPGAVVYALSALWCVCDDGQVRKLSAGDTPAVTATVDVDADTDHWIAASGDFVIAPGPAGGVVSLNSSGTIVAELDSVVTGRIAWAIASAGYLYVFDGRGRGAAVRINADGSLTYLDRFLEAPSQLQDILGGYISGNDLRVACRYRNSVVRFSIATPDDVEVTSTTRYDYDLAGVLEDASIITTDTPPSLLGFAEWWPASAGIYTNSQYIIIAGAHGLVGMTGSAPVITSSLTASGEVGTAFTYTVTATGGALYYTATGLPAGLSINRTTGVISGTPTTGATTSVTIKAHNAYGADSETLVLTITAEPDDFANLAMWFDASDAANYALDGSEVTQWNDLSGNGRHAVPSNVSTRPEINLNAINGMPGIDFLAAAADRLVVSSPPAFDDDTGFTFAAVFLADTRRNTEPSRLWQQQALSSGRFNIGASACGPTSDPKGAAINAGNYNVVGYEAFGQGTLAEALGVARYVVGRFNPSGTQLKLWVNGVAGDPVTASVTGLNPSDGAFWIGNDSDAVTRGLDGKIGELILFNGARSDAEIDQINHYLRTKWGF